MYFNQKFLRLILRDTSILTSTEASMEVGGSRSNLRKNISESTIGKVLLKRLTILDINGNLMAARTVRFFFGQKYSIN